MMFNFNKIIIVRYMWYKWSDIVLLCGIIYVILLGKLYLFLIFYNKLYLLYINILYIIIFEN